METKNINSSKNIINIINFNNNIDYLKKLTDLNVNMISLIYKVYRNCLTIITIHLNYHNNSVLKILKSLNLKLILHILNYKFKCIYKFIHNIVNRLSLYDIHKNKVLQLIKIENVINIFLTKLYSNTKTNLKLVIDLLNYYINKIKLHNLLKNKVLKIMNIYNNKLTLTKFNYYSLQLKILKLKIMDIKSNFNESLTNYLDLKIYSYLLLLLLYISSTTIPLALIAFP